MPANSPASIQIRKLLATPEPPDLGPGPRASVVPLKELNEELDDCFNQSALPGTARQALRAAILLWHDHLDASHRISQDLHDSDGSYVHGIMHRREPDYGNAKYWFHRVGKHPCFDELAQKAAPLLQDKAHGALRSALLPGGQWDPFAFVDACEKASGRPTADSQIQLLRAIQALEFELLIERFCRSD